MPSPTRFMRPAAIAAAVCAGGLAAGVAPALAAFPGANGKIAFTSDRASISDIWVMNPDGGELVNLTPDSPSDEGLPRWRADGRKIVYSSDSNALGTNPTPPGFDTPDFEIFTMNADGSKIRQLTFNDVDDDWPAWSPDGRRVVFQRDFDLLIGPDHRNYDVVTIKVYGRDERRLTNTPGRDGAPNWSPNGRRIAFDSQSGDPEGEPDIYTMNPDGSRVRRLTHGPSFNGQPNWSPNGRKISFQSWREEQLAIYTMRGDGSDETEVSDDVPDAFGTAWSPDGRFIAHSSFTNPDIYTFGLPGGGVHNLTDDSPAFDFAPDWQPLPRKGH